MARWLVIVARTTNPQKQPNTMWQGLYGGLVASLVLCTYSIVMHYQGAACAGIGKQQVVGSRNSVLGSSAAQAHGNTVDAHIRTADPRR